MLKTDATSVRHFTFSRHAAMLAFVAGTASLAAHAQQAAEPTGAVQESATLLAANNQPLNLATAAAVNYSSSTSSTDVDTKVEENGLDLSGLTGDSLLQPPPRRRYGRPRYNDSSHNPDGSNKYAFLLGVGAGVPVQDFHSYTVPSYGVQVGAGRNFNKNFAVFLQFDYDNFSFQGNTLLNQLNLYNYEINLYNQTSGSGQAVPTLGSLDGNNHIWSFTLDPTFTLYSGEGLGAYVVGGVGFYHKVATFTTPTTGYAQDPYSGYVYAYQANQTIEHYSSNAPGFSGGFGLTYKPSRFAGERFFAEIRYVYMLNSQRYGLSLSNINNPPSNTDYNNQYAPNSNRTAYLPIKVGIRF